MTVIKPQHSRDRQDQRTPAPQATGYRSDSNLARYYSARSHQHMDGGPPVVSALAIAAPSLARGLGQWADVLQKQEEEKQTLDAMKATQDFQDREREMFTQMEQMKGEAGFNATGFADTFYEKEGGALLGRAKGNYQRMYFENFLTRTRDQGLNVAFGHRSRELEAYKNSVMDGTMVNLLSEVDAAPSNWQAIEARGIAAIRATNPGLDTTAREHEFKKTLAQMGIESAVARGDGATAQALVNNLGTSKDKAVLEAAFAEAASKARVKAGTQIGLQRGQEGESYEFYNEVVDDIATGKRDPDEGRDILQAVKTIEETGRQQRKAQRDDAEEQAKNEWLQAEADGTFDINKFRNDGRLSADYRERRIKEETSTRKPNLDSVPGREIDFKIKSAIDTGRIYDLPSLFAAVNEVDPEGQFISSKVFTGYETRLKEALKPDADGNPKINYLTDAIQAIGKRSEFQANTNDKKAQKAFELMRLRDAVLRELELDKVSVFDPAAAKYVQKAFEAKVVTEPGLFGGTKEQWYKTQPDQRGPLFGDESPQRRSSTGGVGGILGGSMLAAGTLAQTALDMVERGEAHWLTEYSENDPAIAFALLAEEQTRTQGLPLTPYTQEWVSQGLLEHRPAREVTPSFAMAWPGQGRVTANTLGRVNDYNDLIERHALSYGLDPNLMAAMMYVESKGDRFAASGAGAQGLMQFMPDTARRFGITDRTDPEQSIRGACQYMRWLLDRYDGDVSKAVGAYNAGEGNVDKGRYPKETQAYIPKVLSIWQSAGNSGFAQSPGSINAAPGSGGFVAPLAGMTVTSGFGPRNTGIAGASTNHKGIDLRAAKGTPVGSIADGVVETATYKGKNGNYVVINHGDGRKSYYLHLDGFAVKPGTRVKAGQIIGKTGNSGDFSKPLAPHLDFRISENGQFVDPSRYFTNLQYKKKGA